MLPLPHLLSYQAPYSANSLLGLCQYFSLVVCCPVCHSESSLPQPRRTPPKFVPSSSLVISPRMSAFAGSLANSSLRESPTARRASPRHGHAKSHLLFSRLGPCHYSSSSCFRQSLHGSWSEKVDTRKPKWQLNVFHPACCHQLQEDSSGDDSYKSTGARSGDRYRVLGLFHGS